MAYDGDEVKVNQNLIDADILDRAADYIEKHGHCKLQFYNSNGSACFMGVINAGRTGKPLKRFEEVSKDCLSHLANMCGFSNLSEAVYWNDLYATEEEIIARFRASASKLRHAN